MEIIFAWPLAQQFPHHFGRPVLAGGAAQRLGVECGGEVRIVIESWRRFYNTLGYRPPAPQVFIPQSARAASLTQPASPPALALRPPMH